MEHARRTNLHFQASTAVQEKSRNQLILKRKHAELKSWAGANSGYLTEEEAARHISRADSLLAAAWEFLPTHPT
jgi:hypothetical protein